MITLTAPLTFGVGGSTVETADEGAACTVHINWISANQINSSVTGEMGYGTSTPFTKSTRANSLYVNVDITTGNWSCQLTGQTGTMTTGQLNALLNSLKSFRNMFENFVVSAGIMPGTITPW